MTRHFIRILIGLTVLSVHSLSVFAASNDGPSPVLLRMDKEEGLISSQLVLTFTRVPQFKVKTSGQRIDVAMEGIELSGTLRNLAPDSTLIDVIMARKPQSVVGSFLLRRPPARVETVTHSNPARIILNLFWERQAKGRPSISYRIDGSVQVDGLTAKRMPGSRFQGRWLSFFDEYRSPFVLKAPVAYTMPELEIPGAVKKWQGPVSIADAMDVGNWVLIRDKLAQVEIPATPEDTLLGQTVLAEALLRTGAVEEAVKILKRLNRMVETPSPRVRYLTALAKARQGDLYGALVEITEMKINPDLESRWVPRIELLQTEIALSTGSARRALRILQGPGRAWPEALHPIRDLRLLDARAIQAKLVGAGEAYRPWLEKSLIYRHPRSLGHAAVGLVRTGDFNMAKEVLTILEKQVKEPQARAMGLYAHALVDDQLDPTVAIEGRLHSIRQDYPNTEAADRAWLVLLDRQVLASEGQESAGALVEYSTIARRSLVREVRQEAGFKHALLLYLNGRLSESIDALSTFRRGNFRSSLRAEATALLAEALPAQIKQLIDEGKDMEALVLVERHRSLLLQKGLDTFFLYDLALSMNRLGLWERAVRVYLYLLEGADQRPDIANQLYLPLIRLYFDNMEYGLAERYAKEYFERFSLGEDRFRIYEYWLKAVHAQKKTESLLFLLGRPDRPSDDELEALACELYWELGDYEMVQRLAIRIKRMDGDLAWRARYLQAESLYRLGRFRQAHRLYQDLEQQAFYLEPSLYRQARIQLEWNQRTRAATLLEQLLEDGKHEGWKALAQDLLNDLGKR